MAKKVPLPKVKAKKMHWLDKLFMGIGGLSPYFGKARLHQSMSKATESGRAARAAQRAAMIAKYGKGAMRVGRFAGLMNPWTAVPYALTYGAKHLVGNALEGYKNQDVEDTGAGPLWLFDNRGISEEGAERLYQERLAREELAAANRAKREGTWVGKLYERMLNQLSSAGMNEGGIARLL